MAPPDLLKAFFRSGVFIILVSVLMVLALPRDSAEFVISICSLTIGLALVGLVILVSRLAR